MRTRERIDPSQLDIKDNVVSINRVTKVDKGGKNLSFSPLVVVGGGRGCGARLAQGSGGDRPAARQRARGLRAPGSVTIMANQRTDTKGATVKVTLVRSPVGFNRHQAAVVQGLGLRRIRHTVELKDT